MQNLSPPTQPAETLAEVRAHDQVMRYRRAGAGRPLLVLRGAGEHDALWPELDAELVAHHRVFIPELPAECDDLAAFVADFLEGLGLDRVVVLAAEPCCLSALELALLDASRVERLVLVPGGGAGETGLDGTLATTVTGAAVPLLVVRRGLSAADALPLLRTFLDDVRHPTAVG
jgi:pimeloyl-ACP methyl ester carboxylesterase